MIRIDRDICWNRTCQCLFQRNQMQKVRNWFFLLFKKRTKYLLLYVGWFSPLSSCNWLSFLSNVAIWYIYNQPSIASLQSIIHAGYASQISTLNSGGIWPCRLFARFWDHIKDFFLKINIFPETVSWLFWAIHRACSTVFIGVIKYSLFLAYSAAFDHFAWPFLANGTCSCVPIWEIWLHVTK